MSKEVSEEQVEAQVVDVVTEAIEKTSAAPLAQMGSQLALSALSSLKAKLSGTAVSQKNFMLIVRYVMEVVEGEPIKGSAQKQLAIEVLTLFVKETDMEASEKEACLALISSGTVESTIDLVVDASRGRLNINAASEVAVGCLSSCLSFLKKRNTRRALV